MAEEEGHARIQRLRRDAGGSRGKPGGIAENAKPPAPIHYQDRGAMKTYIAAAQLALIFADHRHKAFAPD